MTRQLPLPPKAWRRADGSIVACTESVKVLEDNWREAAELLTDFFEDAILLGVSKAEFRRAMHELADGIECAYEEQAKTGASSLAPDGKKQDQEANP